MAAQLKQLRPGPEPKASKPFSLAGQGLTLGDHSREPIETLESKLRTQADNNWGRKTCQVYIRSIVVYKSILITKNR